MYQEDFNKLYKKIYKIVVTKFEDWNIKKIIDHRFEELSYGTDEKSTTKNHIVYATLLDYLTNCYLAYDESLKITESNFISMILKLGREHAIRRYMRVEHLKRKYVSTLNNSNYPNIVINEFAVDNKISIESFTDKLNDCLEQIKSLSNNNTIAYEKVKFLNEHFLSIVFKDVLTDVAGKNAYRILLSKLRLYYLNKEITQLLTILQKSTKEEFISYIDSLYGESNIKRVLEENSDSNFQRYSESLLYFYPKFMREYIAKYLKNELTEEDMAYENLKDHYVDYIIGGLSGSKWKEKETDSK